MCSTYAPLHKLRQSATPSAHDAVAGQDVQDPSVNPIGHRTMASFYHADRLFRAPLVTVEKLGGSLLRR